MTHRRRIVALLVMAVAAAAGAASAQEAGPAQSFDALAGRIRVGERIWVTDVAGREIRGRLERLSSDGLVVKDTGLQTFTAQDVRRVRARSRDSLKNGTLIGLGIGAGMGTAWCIGAVADDSGDIDARVECGEGFTVFPALGALIGLAVDAVIPGRMLLLYDAPQRRDTARRTLTIAPWVSSQVKGLRVSFAY